MESEEIRELSFEHPIVFFDGVCGLCNGVVDWLLRHDRNQLFRFAPLQGSTAQALLPKTDIEQLGSIVLLRNGLLHRKSDAALWIFSHSRTRLRFLGTALRLVPRPLRDFVYDFIAHHRYGWFGQAETCRIPTPSERGRFLD